MNKMLHEASDIRGKVTSLVKQCLKTEACLPGAVLYNGWDTLRSSNGLYIMGFNPGGDPEKIKTSVLESLETLKSNYCSYLDECWLNSCQEGCKEKEHLGKSRHQKVVCNLVQFLGSEIGKTVAVNAVFLRSRNQNNLAASYKLFKQCWPVHEMLLEITRPKIILCLGNGEPRSAFAFLRSELAPNAQPSADQVKSFFAESLQCHVIGVRHPSYPWFNPVKDIKSYFEKNLSLAQELT